MVTDQSVDGMVNNAKFMVFDGMVEGAGLIGLVEDVVDTVHLGTCLCRIE